MIKNEERKLIDLQIQVVLNGDILAMPVYNQQGCLLLNKGANITQQNKERLKKHGVKKIYVAERDEPIFQKQLH
jgi:hypothetical protein